eukprot:CAMPEP_0172500108 /NCGR_PEP_ID=MMETSP1066-20121228/134792_1 /TAXON_ID=671091 /ORGANISM="Coscinodiscus wailesii, Strain CCMP2513" /LENGTH=365 /DNA_ID=CAMNT_0013274195 /DNA_START=205 /DNA_END=1302 /DNA_ORIENTATION=+
MTTKRKKYPIPPTKYHLLPPPKKITLLLLLLLISTHQKCASNAAETVPPTATPLTYHEIQSLRARDIKRQLARRHGYSADELAKMLDKKELIETLAFEEHKEEMKRMGEEKREKARIGILVALGCVVVVTFWPLLSHVWEVMAVNFVVYTDKKKYEMSQCYTLKSVPALLGILLLFLLDALQLWLSLSVMLSWIITRNAYFFPTPNIPVRPTQLLSGAATTMGGRPSTSALDGYGINVGPMLVTWGLRYVKGKVELWTGKVLSRAFQVKKKEEKMRRREGETEEERRERKARRREEKRKMKEEEEEERARIGKERLRRQAKCMEDAFCPVDKEHDEVVVGGVGGSVSVDDCAGAFVSSSSFDDID